MDAAYIHKTDILHKTALEPTHAFDSKKLLFLIPIIIGLGLLFLASMSGVGLFAKEAPQWLTHIVTTIGQPGHWTFWTLMLGCAVFGLVLIVASVYSMAKKGTTESLLEEEIFFGTVHTVTYNRGQEKDIPFYENLQNKPLELTEQQRTILESHGCDASHVQLKPAYEDQGKCAGGTTHFLKLALSNTSTKRLIGIFKDGVPREAAINHEIYRQIFAPPTELTLKEHVETGLKTIAAFFSPVKTSQPSTEKPMKQDPSCSMERHDLALLSLNNLAVEEIIFDFEKSRAIHFTSFEQLADYVVDQIPDLAPGAYKLALPNYTSLGGIKGTHILGFVKREKTTLFYDANFSITEVNNRDNQATIRRVLRYYTGYSTTLREKMANIWHGKPNMPPPLASWETITLIKVKLAEGCRGVDVKVF